jgi:hypothetical protein
VPRRRPLQAARPKGPRMPRVLDLAPHGYRNRLLNRNDLVLLNVLYMLALLERLYRVLGEDDPAEPVSAFLSSH